MERRQRVMLVGIAAAIAVAAVSIALVTNGGGDGPGATTEPAGAAPQAAPDPAERTQTAEPEPPAPGASEILVKDGKPVGGVAEIDARKNDTVQIAVRADAAEHLHLHGYDVVKDLAPGETTRLEFKADIEGVFEIELEDSGTQVAEVTVAP